jgi:hypothetical protein
MNVLSAFKANILVYLLSLLLWISGQDLCAKKNNQRLHSYQHILLKVRAGV